jgi:hypothetical protein
MTVQNTTPPTRKRNLPHKPTVKSKNIVKSHVIVGTPQEIVADILGITSKTLRKHYREQLDQGLALANVQIGGKLFSKAMKGDTTALIFWAKTRMGFREPREGDGEVSPAAVTINIVNPNGDN